MQFKTILFILCAGLLAACNRGGSEPATDSQTVVMSNGEEGELIGKPAPGSKFAKIQLNMSRRQVENLIGPPDDESGHITGKAFIPFFFGGDTHRLEAFYKGEGQLTYAPRNLGADPNQLIKIEVNTAATGIAD